MGHCYWVDPANSPDSDYREGNLTYFSINLLKPLAATVCSFFIISEAVLAQGSPTQASGPDAVLQSVQSEIDKYVNLKDLVGSAGAVVVNEPTRYINSAFLLDKSGNVKNFIPANLLKNFASEGFDPSWEITTIGSGISDGSGASSGGLVAANLEQTIFDYVFKNDKDGNFQILVFSFGASKEFLHRLSYTHRYNVDGVGLSDSGIIEALNKWVLHVDASDTDYIVYVGNIGIREFKQERLTKVKRNASITGWAYGSADGLFARSTQSVNREYHFSVDSSDTIDVATLKIMAEQMKLGSSESMSGPDFLHDTRDMTDTRAFFDRFSE